MISFEVTLKVFGLLSQKIGFAPQYKITFAELIYDKVGTITSSPGLISRDANAAWRAEVPLLNNIACLIFKYFVRSKWSIRSDSAQNE